MNQQSARRVEWVHLFETRQYSVMVNKNHSPDEARQPVFDTENLADEEVARSNPEKKSFWSTFALKAILNVNLDDDIEPKRLSEADVDEVCRGALAGGLTPGGLDSPFNR